MAAPGNSSSTDHLEFTSLQLDVQLLQMNRDQDRMEFDEFREYVQTNFGSVQKSLADLQGTLSGFLSGFPKPKENPPNPMDVPQASAMINTPQGPVQRGQDQFKSPHTVGSATLVDKHTGKELNLDGSLKHPYRHPHFSGKQQPPDAISQPTANPPQQILQLDPEQRDANVDRRLGTPQDNRDRKSVV